MNILSMLVTLEMLKLSRLVKDVSILRLPSGKGGHTRCGMRGRGARREAKG